MLAPVILTIPALVVPLMMSPAPSSQFGNMADPAAEQRSLARFEAATADYVRLRHFVEPAWPPLSFIADLEAVERRAEQLRAAIRAARPHAGQGDLFTAELAEVLRRRVSTALPDHNEGIAIMNWPDGEDDSGTDWRPVVHDPVPWHVFGATWPVFRLLPPLPPELAYRLIGRTLVLVDVGANLVVDTLDLGLPTRTPGYLAEPQQVLPIDEDFIGCSY